MFAVQGSHIGDLLSGNQYIQQSRFWQNLRYRKNFKDFEGEMVFHDFTNYVVFCFHV